MQLGQHSWTQVAGTVSSADWTVSGDAWYTTLRVDLGQLYVVQRFSTRGNAAQQVTGFQVRYDRDLADDEEAEYVRDVYSGECVHDVIIQSASTKPNNIENVE